VKTHAASTFDGRTKWFGLLLLLLQGISAGSAPLSEFPFKLRAGLIWVQVSSPQSTKPLNFILDSGAESSVIDLQTVRRLRLELGTPVTVRGINTTTLGYWPEFLSAQMGGISLPTNYLAVDLSALSAACSHKAEGLIGADFFSGRVVQIDFAKQMIRLLESCSPAAGAEVVPLQVEAARLRVPVEVEGLGKTWARLDTGCASALHCAASTATFADKGSSEELGVGVSSLLIRQNAKTVRLGHLAFKDVLTGLHSEKLLGGESALMGSGLLSRFSVVTIDEPTERLVLEGLVCPKPPRGTGIR
jgi:hypothetical protein